MHFFLEFFEMEVRPTSSPTFQHPPPLGTDPPGGTPFDRHSSVVEGRQNPRTATKEWGPSKCSPYAGYKGPKGPKFPHRAPPWDGRWEGPTTIPNRRWVTEWGTRSHLRCCGKVAGGRVYRHPEAGGRVGGWVSCANHLVGVGMAPAPAHGHNEPTKGGAQAP